MLLRPGSFPFSLSINHHCTRQCPRNDPSARDSQLCPWGALSVTALRSSASSFGDDFRKEILLLLPLWSSKARCIQRGASHPRTGMQSIPVGQAEQAAFLLQAVLVPRAAASILPCPLASGSLPSHSLMSCNTTCVADTGHFGLELGPVTLFILSRSWCF